MLLTRWYRRFFALFTPTPKVGSTLAEEDDSMLEYAIIREQRACKASKWGPCCCGCGRLARAGWVCAHCALAELHRRGR